MSRDNLTCPRCGGTMDYLENDKKYCCRYCDYQESEHVNIEEEIERARKEERLSAKEEFLNERERNLNEREYMERRNPSRIYIKTSHSNPSNKRKHPSGHIIGTLMGVILFLTLISSCSIAIKMIADNDLMTISDSARTEINPFENLTIKAEGADHKGKLRLLDKVDGVFYELSKDTNLSNGDTVTIKASSAKYKLTKDEINYTIEGLTNLLSDRDELTDEIWEKIRTFSNEEIDKSTTGTDASIELTPYRLYMVTIEGENRFFDCYKAKVSLNGDSLTCYHVILHKNVKYSNKNNKLIVLEDDCEKYGKITSLYTDKDTYCGAYYCFKTIEDLENKIKADYPEMDSLEMVFERK